jgi:2-oxoglutarate ferredoxin oxidoreductase subunit beta
MKPVFEYTKGMRDQETHYCPGCTHGVAHRLVMEVLSEKEKLGETIGVCPVGCSILAHQYMDVDMIEAAHGRAPAVATGIKRVHPRKLVFTYQGDGDLASIGMGEIVHAAHRGENFCTFFINNAIYGMTGGQMAPTTLIGQKATTAIHGRDSKLTGNPIGMAELLATVEGAVFVERVALNTPAHIRKAKKAIQNAFLVQEKGLGFAFVELLSICPINWGLPPTEAVQWLENNMIPVFPLKSFRFPKEGLE